MRILSYCKRLFSSISMLFCRISRDRVQETASALTYQTVLALVPLFAVLFGIAKGFSLDKLLEEVLQTQFADHQEVLHYILTFSQTALEQMKSGLIAGLGIIFLLLTTTNLLFTTENVMNRMWGVSKGRSLARRIIDFQSCLFLFPILIVISASTTIFIQTLLYSLQEAWPISFVLQLLPLATVLIVLYLGYWLIPYVPIKKRYALLTAAVVTCLFHFMQSWYIYLQVKLTQTSVIYGSFAALPLFLVWLWISWYLFLLGAEFMVFLHEKGWKQEILEWTDSEQAYLELTTKLLQCLVHDYRDGKVLSISEYQEKLLVPRYALAKVVETLQERELLYTFSLEQKYVMLVPSYRALSPQEKA